MSNSSSATKALELYVHSLRYAYAIAATSADSGLIDETIDTLYSYLLAHNQSSSDGIRAIRDSMNARLNIFDCDLATQLLDEVKSNRVMTEFGDFDIYMWSLQSLEWYDCDPASHDFFLESRLGLHDNAEVIYDFGMHAGVWSMYYSMLVGDRGKVYAFEPSLLNVEQALASFYLNHITNIRVFPLAVGTEVNPNPNDILVDFQSQPIYQIPVSYCLFDKPDFIKIDIEGFEYEIIKAMPQLFNVNANIHLEVHIPHLQRRGLDYNEITNLIPVDKFSIFMKSTELQPANINDFSGLKGYCSLFLKQIDQVKI